MSYFTMGYGMIPTASPAEIKQAVEEVAPAIIEEQVGTVVDDKIDTKIEDAVSRGESDDVQTFASRSAFPTTGITGVEYIALDTGYEYAWNNGEYVLLNEHDAMNTAEVNALSEWDN